MSASESTKHSFLGAITGLMSQNTKMCRGLNGYILQVWAATNEFLCDWLICRLFSQIVWLLKLWRIAVKTFSQLIAIEQGRAAGPHNGDAETVVCLSFYLKKKCE